MECPTCSSIELQRNGRRNQVQCYKCKRCGRQFLASYKQMRYSEDIKQLCLRMHAKGMSTRTIEKLTDIHHTTILSWVREVGREVGQEVGREVGQEVGREVGQVKQML